MKPQCERPRLVATGRLTSSASRGWKGIRVVDSVAAILADCWTMIRQDLPQTLALRRDIMWKADGSPVTKADYRHEAIIGDFLRSRIPGITLVAEESYRAGMDLSSDWIAILDPIDGTENFCSGLKEWGVALSLWHGGRHEGSALMLPEMGDAILSGSPVEKFQSRIVGCSSSYNDEIGSIVAASAESRIMGCAVYNSFNVIRGTFARFVNPKGAYCWDLQAGVSLALEYECEVLLEGKTYDGRLLSPDRRHRVDIRHRYDLHTG
jgi:myo-inositol-1(or 4)-monophosphatase